LKLTKFNDASLILRVSAKTGVGIETLRDQLITFIQAITKTKKPQKFFTYPIDHYFKKKGIGLVVTGTTQGSTSVGKTHSVIPHFTKVKIKNAQVYHQNVQNIPHGFRAGLVLSGIEESILQRGDILTDNPSIYVKTELVEAKFEITNHFQKTVRFGSQINITHGMVTSPARFFPFFSDKNNHKMQVNEVDNKTIKQWNREETQYGALLWFQQPQYVNTNEILILSNLDIPPTSLRFFGSANITSILDPTLNPKMYHVKTKEGRIRNPEYSDKTVLVEGLAKSKEGAQTIINRKLEAPYGRIISVFGGKGVLVVEKPANYKCETGDEVFLKLLRSVTISKNKSYN
jgi:selenocysteine-specific elongation factor